MADLLHSLPVDETPLNHDEINILQTLFKDENTHDLSTIFIELKDAVIGGILFAILSSNKFDNIIYRFVPTSKNSASYNDLFKDIDIYFSFLDNS